MVIKETPVGVTAAHTAPSDTGRRPSGNQAIHTVAVIGCGLIGTSVALALRRRGVIVHLNDIDPTQAAAAANLGAGIPGPPPVPVDLTVIAVPPGSTAAVLADCQAKGLSRIYTDVASVKCAPAREAEWLGCDLATYVGGHPMAGGERSGPAAASAGLFDDRVWVLTPDNRTRPDALRAVEELLTRLGARPVVMPSPDHDRAVARTSHVPHLISALLAARLADTNESVLALCGAGIRDTTRIAAGNPHLWTDILRANADEITTVLTEFATDLHTATQALHHDPTPLTALLARGNAGRAALTTPPQSKSPAISPPTTPRTASGVLRRLVAAVSR
ncbi:prephenate dehydrogenase [Nocardia wallacei]|uniref:prephenate dehydrogenase n=1 Tax=Nocardia wallacei TaxID=480035 RepID=UPI0024564B99|nr:prephenate dehydrogenase [Nocardia wallacei]